MSHKIIIEPLDPSKHVREAFDCTVPELNTYLKERANKEAKQNISKTYIAHSEIEPQTIIGYYTISSYSVVLEALPSTLTKRLPNYPYVPAILIGRLAVDVRYHNQGFGRRLLVNALQKAHKLSQEITILAVIVHAKNNDVADFYKQYGFSSFPDESLHLFLPI